MIVLIGLNHKTAPIAVRGKKSRRLSRGKRFALDLLLLTAFGKFWIFPLATGLKLLLESRRPKKLKLSVASCDFLAQNGGLTPTEAVNCFYEYRGAEAVRHIFRVAASLDSLVMGETQIWGK